MSKKSFAAAAEALLNAQKVDASVITDECGNIISRWCSTACSFRGVRGNPWRVWGIPLK